MPSQDKTEIIARKLLPIIYVLDTSGSMAGDRISSVNEAMKDVVQVLREVADDNPTADIKMGVMQFDTNAKWVTKGLVYLDDYYWNDISAGGLTSVAAALDELDKSLSRSKLLTSDVGYKAPVIIFMTDGYPTDDEPVLDRSLNRIGKNKWFQCATKIGVGVGDDFDRSAIVKVVGNNEAVIEVRDTETLKKLIRVVSVTASMVGSKSRSDGDDPIVEIMTGIQDEMDDESDMVLPDPKPTESKTSDPASDTSTGWSNPGGWDEDWD